MKTETYIRFLQHGSQQTMSFHSFSSSHFNEVSCLYALLPQKSVAEEKKKKKSLVSSG